MVGYQFSGVYMIHIKVLTHDSNVKAVFVTSFPSIGQFF